MGDEERSASKAEHDAAVEKGGEATASAARDDPSSSATGSTRWRRLHTLSGGLVLGAFLVEHIVTNASALGGHAAYDAIVGSLLRFRLLPLFEIIFILVPLGFHAGYGVHLIRSRSAPDAEIERYGNRRLWIVQRISAVFVFVFVLVHLWELRAQRLLFGLPADAVYTTLTAHLSWTWAGVPWMALFYLVGIFAAAFHLSNGLYACTAAWNVGSGRPGRRRVRVLTSALGLILFFAGAGSVICLATGTLLLPGSDDDSAPQAPCGSAVTPAHPPFKVLSPSR
jgi:succinate dehydrogenase / fumarate reductase cytochrome b subunit